jgi:hypothetical protein
MASISDFISDINLFDFIDTLVKGQFFDVVFPFLLVYAILITILPRVKLFQNKSGTPFKPVIIIVSLIVTLFSVSFTLPSGYTIGMYMALLFPNISTLTITVLSLYVVGGILGVDVFKGMFSKGNSAYLFFVVAAIGLGAVVFYTGIVLGFWSYNPYDSLSLWNVTLAVGLGILGIVFLIAGSFMLGGIMLFVVATFILGDQERSILFSFLDPVMFVLILFSVLLFLAMGSGDKKNKLAKDLREAEKTREDYVQRYSGMPKDYDSRVFDILDEGYKKNKKDWEKQFGNEKY